MSRRLPTLYSGKQGDLFTLLSKKPPVSLKIIF